MDSLSCNTSTSKGFSLRSLFNRCRQEYSKDDEKERLDYLKSVEDARRELENIESIFNNTSDPDLIEYAIYAQRAVKLKLSYLIKKAKENNIKSADYTWI